MPFPAGPLSIPGSEPFAPQRSKYSPSSTRSQNGWMASGSKTDMLHSYSSEAKMLPSVFETAIPTGQVKPPRAKSPMWSSSIVVLPIRVNTSKSYETFGKP